VEVELNAILIVSINVITLYILYEHVRNQMHLNKIISQNHAKRRWRFQDSSSQTSLTKNFYRMYKYMYVQSTSGSRPEDILKNLYHVVSDKKMKKSLLQMSVIITQNNDIKQGLTYLKKQFSHDEGMILISILEGALISGMSRDSFLRLDHMLFQKYLSQMRHDTKKIKKKYFFAVVCFVISASGVIFLPLVDQMFKSADIIFK